MPDSPNSSEVLGGPKLVAAPRAREADIALALETPLLRVWHLRVPHPWHIVNSAEYFADIVHLFRRDDRIEVVCDTARPSSTHAILIIDDPAPEGGVRARELAILKRAA